MQKLQLRSMLQAWLEEDLGSGDITSEVLVASQQVNAIIHAKEPGVIAGLEAAAEVFRLLDSEAQCRCLVSDGETVQAGALLAEISGSARALLSGERLALNLLQHLSGIATQTARWQKLLHGTRACLTDTRKTLPGLRQLQKQAVRLGGGTNHRMGLFDGVLIEDNHIKIAGGVAKAVRLAKERAPHTLKVEVEVEDLAGVAEALSVRLGYPIELLAQVPIDPAVSATGDAGVPLVSAQADSPAARALDAVAERLAARKRGLAGRKLSLHVS